MSQIGPIFSIATQNMHLHMAYLPQIHKTSGLNGGLLDFSNNFIKK